VIDASAPLLYDLLVGKETDTKASSHNDERGRKHMSNPSKDMDVTSDEMVEDLEATDEEAESVKGGRATGHREPWHHHHKDERRAHHGR
jgi:hypothetical protein